MAKDKLGHGSEKRGSMSVWDRHQYRIAVDTVKNPMKGMFLGGPTASQAEQTLREKFGHSDADIARMKGDPVRDAFAKAAQYGAGSPQVGDAVHSIAQSELARVNAESSAPHPKSAPAPVHDSIADTLKARSDRARIAEQNEFQRTRITKGPHYLDPKDPRGRR